LNTHNRSYLLASSVASLEKLYRDARSYNKITNIEKYQLGGPPLRESAS
jgi:hypothetical protein